MGREHAKCSVRRSRCSSIVLFFFLFPRRACIRTRIRYPGGGFTGDSRVQRECVLRVFTNLSRTLLAWRRSFSRTALVLGSSQSSSALEQRLFKCNQLVGFCDSRETRTGNGISGRGRGLELSPQFPPRIQIYSAAIQLICLCSDLP